jgi:molybdopterin biosynthesis enzyme
MVHKHRAIERFHPVEEVLREVFERVSPIGETELVRPLEAVGRVLAVDVVAPAPRPQADMSHMDGYAVRSSDTAGASPERPARLKIDGHLSLPNVAGPPLAPRHARRILTGGLLPEGADAVVPQEEVEVEDGELVVRNPVTPHQYVDRRGSDVKEGQVIAKRGEVLRPVKSALMEALGIGRVEVFRRPAVSVISIGSELTDDPEEATDLKTLNTHAPTVISFLSALPCVPRYAGLLPDEVGEVSRALEMALRASDMVLTIGGSSVGDTDVASILHRSGNWFFAQGLQLQPGRVGGVAVVDGKPVVVLPALIHSTVNVFNYLAVPILGRLGSFDPEQLVYEVKAELAEDLTFTRYVDFRKVVWVRLERDGERTLCHPMPSESSAFSSIAFADGYIEVPPYRERLVRGEVVTVRRPAWVLSVPPR